MESKTSKRIAIIIPTFNERTTIASAIEKIFKTIPHAKIIVVDDNSPDLTAELVETLRKLSPNLFLIKRVGKGGRGSAVIEGFKFAYEKLKADIFIEMDADLSHDPRELRKIVSLSKPGSVVLASRYLPQSRIINWPKRRLVMSRISNFLIHLILKLPAKDNTNGYRCYQREAVELLLKHQFVSRGYIVLSESAKLLFDHGFNFIETPSRFVNRDRGKSNATITEFTTSLKALFKIKNHTSNVK